MNRPYRWGILGAGNIAEKFASAINYTEGAEMYAVASQDENRARTFAEKYGATRYYGDYVRLSDDPEVDIIYIATPHAFHRDQAILCLERGKPVLSEKPMALSSSQVQDMIDASHKHKRFLMEGMWSRFMPSINKTLQIIEDDVIGPVQYVQADFGIQAPFNPDRRMYNLKLGGGSILDVGVYPIFLATLLLGDPVLVQSVGKLSHTGVDEYASIQLQYKQGQIANIFSAITIKTSLRAEIAGPKGRVILHNPFYKATTMSLELNSGGTEDFSFPYEHNGFEYEIRAVMKCLDEAALECTLMPLEMTLRLAAIMDKVRAQCGVIYEGT
jgi:predicted dehydrogenase